MSHPPHGTGPGDEDVDARFRSIIDAEFGPGPAAGRGRPPVRRPPSPTEGATSGGAATGDGPSGRGADAVGPDTPGSGAEAFDMTRALDEAEPGEPDEPFVAPGPQPVPIPRGRALAGAVLLLGSLVVVLAGLFGMTLPRPVGTGAVVGFVAGLAILLSCLPRTPRDPHDDGARV